VSVNRREFVQTTSYAALNAAMTGKLSGIPQAATTPTGDVFDINQAFAVFMKDIGQSPSDGGGTVTFTGKDPILRSHFRIGACMAIPAMAAGVSAAAIWRERTGEDQDLKVDLRESVYNVNPLIGAVLIMAQRDGSRALARRAPSPNTAHRCSTSRVTRPSSTRRLSST
jgi:hypothetical protein